MYTLQEKFTCALFKENLHAYSSRKIYMYTLQEKFTCALLRKSSENSQRKLSKILLDNFPKVKKFWTIFQKLKSFAYDFPKISRDVFAENNREFYIYVKDVYSIILEKYRDIPKFRNMS